MKITKILAAAAACSVAATMLAVSASAYDLNKDLKTGWSASITVPAEEFEDATPDSVWTLTFTADASLADSNGHNYWCVKPMINDTGWPFINTLVGPALSEGGDSYPVDPEATEIKFTIPAAELDHLKEAGMAFMGHGVTLGKLTFSDTDTLPAATEATTAAPETVEETTVVEEVVEDEDEDTTVEADVEEDLDEEVVEEEIEETPAETTAAETTAATTTAAAVVDAAVEETTAAAIKSGNANPPTGVGIAGGIVAMLAAGGAMVASRKRK